MQIQYPLAIGNILLLQTTIACLTRGTVCKRFCFSYVLFMIMIGFVAWQKEDVTFSFRVEEKSEDGGRKFLQTLVSVWKITLYHVCSGSV